YVLHCRIALCISVAWALLSVAGTAPVQAQQSSLSTGVVQPVPVVPTPLISSQTSTACVVGCDTQAMNCQNACIVVGASAAVTTSPSSASACNLSCTTSQLVCKQGCIRPSP